jgi:hypothetical protein
MHCPPRSASNSGACRIQSLNGGRCWLAEYSAQAPRRACLPQPPGYAGSPPGYEDGLAFGIYVVIEVAGDSLTHSARPAGPGKADHGFARLSAASPRSRVPCATSCAASCQPGAVPAPAQPPACAPDGGEQDVRRGPSCLRSGRRSAEKLIQVVQQRDVAPARRASSARRQRQVTPRNILRLSRTPAGGGRQGPRRRWRMRPVQAGASCRARRTAARSSHRWRPALARPS